MYEQNTRLNHLLYKIKLQVMYFLYSTDCCKYVAVYVVLLKYFVMGQSKHKLHYYIIQSCFKNPLVVWGIRMYSHINYLFLFIFTVYSSWVLFLHTLDPGVLNSLPLRGNNMTHHYISHYIGTCQGRDILGGKLTCSS